MSSRLSLNTRRLLAVALLPTVLGGCVTTDVSLSRSPTASPNEARLQVAIFKSPSRQSDGPLPGRVDTQLVYLGPGTSEILLSESHGTWEAPRLRPGKYRLEVLGWELPNGRYRKRASPAHESFTLREGSGCDVHVFLSDKRGILWTIVGGAAAGLFGFLAAHTK
jgi:hypothetical protein